MALFLNLKTVLTWDDRERLSGQAGAEIQAAGHQKASPLPS
jgi:hypothetical protein